MSETDWFRSARCLIFTNVGNCDLYVFELYSEHTSSAKIDFHLRLLPGVSRKPRYVIFQMAKVAVPQVLFREILDRIRRSILIAENLPEKIQKQLQFYDEVGNLIKFVGLAVLIISVYVKSRIIVQNRGVKCEAGQ